MHETPRIANDTNDVITGKEEDLQVERLCLKILEIQHIDFIGIDKCDFHPNYQLVNFFNKLRKFELSYGIKLDEFRFAKSMKHRKYSKYIFSWHGRFELFQFELTMKHEKYLKYLFYWHGRFQVPKLRLNVEVVKDWLNRGLGRPDSKTNLLEEEGAFSSCRSGSVIRRNGIFIGNVVGRKASKN
ncbi:hypothetical protein LguiB_020683 [Lonicera macranthoides]